jgi:HPt (histidine-containing phosphotransfer) domain-containing protein
VGEGEGIGDAPIDRGYLARQCFGDRALERNLLDLFCRRSAELLDKIAENLDPGEGCDLAHALRGAALAIGAREVAASAAHYESVVRTADPATIARAHQALAEAVGRARTAARARYAAE